MRTKLWKRLISAITVAVMVVAMGMTAFGADGEAATPTGTVTVKGTDGDEYTVYKVLEGTIAGQGEDGDLYTYKPVAPFDTFFGTDYKIDADGLITVGNAEITSEPYTNTNASQASKLAAALANAASGSGVAVLTKDNNFTATLPIGYYVIVQTKTADPADAAKTSEVSSKPILVSVTKDATIEITPKNDTVDLDKEIVENGENVKQNNVNIGDEIEYKVTTEFPIYEAEVGKYVDEDSVKFVLTDTFDTGLTFTKGSVVITGFEEDTDYTIEEEDNGFVVSFKQGTILKNQGEPVVLTYKAKLNEKAEVNSSEGNDNTIKLEYSHNPAEEDGFKTLEDKVTTYTYGFSVHKVDKVTPSTGLNDAKFTVKDEKGNTVYFVENPAGTYTVTKAGTEGTTDTIVSKGEDGEMEMGLASVKGLDAGTYTLTETQAPDKYTKLENPVIVVIEDAGKKDKGTENGTGRVSVGENSADANVVDENGKVTGSIEANDGTINLNVNVPNQKGVSLPETGRNSALYCMIGGAAVIVLGALYYEFAVRRGNKQ